MITPNSNIKRKGMHGIAHDWHLQPFGLAWVYETRFANFYQGFSSAEELESVADPDAVWDAPVLRADEWGKVAGLGEAGLSDAGGDGAAEGIGESAGVRGASTACEVVVAGVCRDWAQLDRVRAMGWRMRRR